MSMTKIDYELIASVINGRKVNDANLGALGYSKRELMLAQALIDDLAIFMSSSLADKNPKFDRDRFLAGCGINNDKEQLK